MNDEHGARAHSSRPARADEAARNEAFRRVFDAELPYVWKTLRRLGAPAADVEDLAHEVFVTVLRRFDEIDPARPVRPWLFGIAFRVYVGDARLSRRRREHVGVEGRDPIDPTPLADERLVRHEDVKLVREALEHVDLARRAVFVMHDLDGHAMSDIADALGIPPNTGYSRLRLARDEFASALRRLVARRRGG